MSGLALDLAHIISNPAQAAGVGLGVMDLTSPATSGEYAMVRGDHACLAINDADGYDIAATIALRSLTSIFAEVGFINAARTHYARLLYDTSVDATRWRAETRDGTTQASTDLPLDLVPVADAFQRVQLRWTPTHVAAWVDGDGPHAVLTNLPGEAFTPYVLVGTRTSSAKTLRVDSVTVDALAGPLAHPTEDPLLALAL